MTNLIGDIPNINKEEIAFLHFPKEDILYATTDKLDRELQLKKALSLGNLEHFKVKIYFQDIEGAKTVETTIWGVTNTSIILKQGITIPIARVFNITFI